MKGTKLGPFVLLDKLGEGGMGVVHKAKDTCLDRLVAIKLLPESLASDPSRRAHRRECGSVLPRRPAVARDHWS